MSGCPPYHTQAPPQYCILSTSLTHNNTKLHQHLTLHDKWIASWRKILQEYRTWTHTHVSMANIFFSKFSTIQNSSGITRWMTVDISLFAKTESSTKSSVGPLTEKESRLFCRNHKYYHSVMVTMQYWEHSERLLFALYSQYCILVMHITSCTWYNATVGLVSYSSIHSLHCHTRSCYIATWRV